MWSIDRTWKPRERWSRPALTVEHDQHRHHGRNQQHDRDTRPIGTHTRQASTRNTCANTRHRDTNTRTRPPSGPRTTTPATRGDNEELKTCGGHGPGETPGPIPNPEAKTWHGDGTAPDRMWESSTPPHQHVKESPPQPVGFPHAMPRHHQTKEHRTWTTPADAAAYHGANRPGSGDGGRAAPIPPHPVAPHHTAASGHPTSAMTPSHARTSRGTTRRVRHATVARPHKPRRHTTPVPSQRRTPPQATRTRDACAAPPSRLRTSRVAFALYDAYRQARHRPRFLLRRTSGQRAFP